MKINFLYHEHEDFNFGFAAMWATAYVLEYRICIIEEWLANDIRAATYAVSCMRCRFIEAEQFLRDNGTFEDYQTSLKFCGLWNESE